MGGGGQCPPALGRGGSVKPTWYTSTKLSLSGPDGGLGVEVLAEEGPVAA